MTTLVHGFGGLNLYEENGIGIHLLAFEFDELEEKNREYDESCKCRYYYDDYAKK